MFDRRFDDSEDDLFSEPVDMTTKSVDGIPSISELLDTLNNRMKPPKNKRKKTPNSPNRRNRTARKPSPIPHPNPKTNPQPNLKTKSNRPQNGCPSFRLSFPNRR